MEQEQAASELTEEQVLNFLVKEIDIELGDNADIDSTDIWDVLVGACPLTETECGLVDEEAFATLLPSVVVVNAARGGIVDKNALVAALQFEKIRGAALDVTDPEPLPLGHPLWGLENRPITPHTGGHTPRH